MDAPFDVVEAMNGIHIISLSPCHDGFEAKNLLGSQHNTLKKCMNEKNTLKLRLIIFIHSHVKLWTVKLVTHQLKGRERLRMNGKLTEIRCSFVNFKIR